MAANQRPFALVGSFKTEGDARAEARRLTKVRSPEIWTTAKRADGKFAVVRKS